MKKLFLAILIPALFINISSSLAQENNTEKSIKDFIQNMGDEIINTAKNTKLKDQQKRQKIINIIDSSIDAKWIARFVLGKHYKTANEEQRKLFMSYYRDFMINTYGPKFNNYDGKKFNTNSVEKQNNFYLVKSEFIPKNSNTTIFFDFRVIEVEGKFLIVDFIAEGISLIETQRSEFNSSINQDGLDKFLENLKNRVIELKSNNEKPHSKNS